MMSLLLAVLFPVVLLVGYFSGGVYCRDKRRISMNYDDTDRGKCPEGCTGSYPIPCPKGYPGSCLGSIPFGFAKRAFSMSYDDNNLGGPISGDPGKGRISGGQYGGPGSGGFPGRWSDLQNRPFSMHFDDLGICRGGYPGSCLIICPEGYLGSCFEFPRSDGEAGDPKSGVGDNGPGSGAQGMGRVSRSIPERFPDLFKEYFSMSYNDHNLGGYGYGPGGPGMGRVSRGRGRGPGSGGFSRGLSDRKKGRFSMIYSNHNPRRFYNYLNKGCFLICYDGHDLGKCPRGCFPRSNGQGGLPYKGPGVDPGFVCPCRSSGSVFENKKTTRDSATGYGMLGCDNPDKGPSGSNCAVDGCPDGLVCNCIDCSKCHCVNEFAKRQI